MRKKFTLILFMAALSLMAYRPSYCDPINAEILVDQYYGATDIQKTELLAINNDAEVSANGVVKDVKEEDTFDIVNDIKRKYYKVITEVQKTPGNNHFDIVLVYKDIGKVNGITKGQPIAIRGKLLKLVDERLFLAVWLYEDNLSQEEKEMFK